MFAIRVATLVISILLLTSAVAPATGWFIALTVLSGLSLVSWGGIGFRHRMYSRWRPYRGRRDFWGEQF